MPTSSQIEISKLNLDLKNFRTVPQKKESDAIKAMISIKPDRFFAVIDSIIEDGYLPTENIIVLNDTTENIVKEGNRRIAALKLIHGLYKIEDFGLPASIIDSIKKIDSKWKTENLNVPCTVFSLNEADLADRIVTLAHGKGEKASRDPWNSVARARHNRDVKGGTEHGLDLLEKYLKKGNNLNNQQRERWGGEYPLTVLDEALRKIYARAGYTAIAELVKNYPKINYLTEIENILLDIGLEQIKFQETLRNAQLDFPTNYNIPPKVATSAQNPTSTQASNVSNPNTGGTSISTTQNNSQNVGTPNSAQPSPNNTSNSNSNNNNSNPSPTPAAPKAVAVNDPKHVAALLKKFAPRGVNRQKVVTLRDELRNLKIASNPIAFCFILRSMFEISSKAYSTDQGLSLTKSGGKDKSLVEVLRGITNHLTSNNSNTVMVKILHGAMTELGKSDGILSVTSMNQLVHNPSFSIAPSDICIMFGNIYPLLEAMN
ncbi:MAG: hypothetical protein WC865_09315 [Bacteroidales bacterium]